MNTALIGDKPTVNGGEPEAWRLYLLVALVGVSLFAIALKGYPSLLDNERRVGGYVLDTVQNGNWLIQRDAMGKVASKPPLVTWMAALVTLGFGEINRFAIVVLSFLFLLHHFLMARSRQVQTTTGMRELAAQVRETFGEQFPLVHVRTPFALQFYLNTGRPLISFERAAGLLREDSAAYVAVSSLDDLLSQFGSNTPCLHELSRWPTRGVPQVRIVSNRPAYDSSAPLATILGPFLVHMEGLDFIRTKGHELVLRSNQSVASISILNQSQSPQPVRVRLLANTSDKGDTVADRILAPGESWRMAP